jgi:GNAT superfamily N-acetyltransferase
MDMQSDHSTESRGAPEPQATSPMPPCEIEWCHAPARAEKLAAFVFDNLETSYISHSELQFGRADGIDRWAGNLHDQLLAEFTERLQQPANAEARLLVAQCDGVVVAVSLVTFNRDVAITHAVVEDLVVEKSKRGRGIGQAVMNWILARAREEGMRRVFLESGLANSRAHSFFERNGFRQVSVVMMADLDDTRN